MPNDTAPAWPLPRPAVMFADHSYPAYSAKQMIAHADAREAAAWAAGAAAMKRDCMDAVPPGHYCHPQDVKDHILALPIPPMPTQGGKSDE